MDRFVLLVIFAGIVCTEASIVHREKRQTRGSNNWRSSSPSRWNNNNFGMSGKLFNFLAASNNVGPVGTSPSPISSTSSWNNNFNGPATGGGSSRWPPAAPSNNRIDMGPGHGPGPGHGGPRFMPHPPPPPPPQMPFLPQMPPQQSQMLPSLGPTVPALGRGLSPAAAPAQPTVPTQTELGFWQAHKRVRMSNLGPNIPNGLLRGLTLMLQQQLRTNWLNGDEAVIQTNNSRQNPLYRMQAEAAGDAYTFNPSPTIDGYPNGRCPAGIRKANCVYNPCPRCRRMTIRCVTNMCGGCTAEMFEFGRRLHDCETI